MNKPVGKITPSVEDELNAMDAQRETNLRYWSALGKTDPAHTKAFQRTGGFRGTAIKPIWITQRLTELFGPAGSGWGTEEPQFTMAHSQDGEVLVYCTVAGWYRDTKHGDRCQVYGVGGDKAVAWVGRDNNRRMVADDEAFKKAFTDAIGNAFKFVGVGADVHMGLFEDSKYLAEVRAEFEEPKAPVAEKREPAPREKLDGPYTCKTQLQTAAREFVRTLNGIGDLAEFVAWKQTKDVKEFVNQLRRDLPDWWEGGPTVPQDFVPLEILVSQKKRDLEALEEVNAK